MFQSWQPDGVWQAFLNIEHSEIDL
jgi:hypothetical protein